MGGYAWVTLATNDSYSLGALVLAYSLKRVKTEHQLAIMITPGVSEAMKTQLSAVFNVVKVVDVLDSRDEENLKLLARPELGITFTKLHCWKFTQFDKCVFLDADTLVLQNSDELFEREELSAAPDIGWPDCFNSGVFVFKPSEKTYKDLIEFALVHGSFDGGDQGLLNLFFGGWATKDIAKHLPFVYNVVSSVTYTYLPAFKQFKDQLKIVHFLGGSKPWLQPFDTETGLARVSGDAQNQSTFIQLWWDIFCAYVHPTLTTSMAGLAGALSTIKLGSPRAQEETALQEHLRRQGWEEGNIDYMGKDSFDNIWKKICETLSKGAAPVSTAEPTSQPRTESAPPAASEPVSPPIPSEPAAPAAPTTPSTPAPAAPTTPSTPVPAAPVTPTESAAPTVPPISQAAVVPPTAGKTEPIKESIKSAGDVAAVTTVPEVAASEVPTVVSGAGNLLLNLEEKPSTAPVVTPKPDEPKVPEAVPSSDIKQAEVKTVEKATLEKPTAPESTVPISLTVAQQPKPTSDSPADQKAVAPPVPVAADVQPPSAAPAQQLKQAPPSSAPETKSELPPSPQPAAAPQPTAPVSATPVPKKEAVQAVQSLPEEKLILTPPTSPDQSVPTQLPEVPPTPQTPTVTGPTPPTSPPAFPQEPLSPTNKLKVETETPPTPPITEPSKVPTLAAAANEPPVPPKRKGGKGSGSAGAAHGEQSGKQQQKGGKGGKGKK